MKRLDKAKLYKELEEMEGQLYDIENKISIILRKLRETMTENEEKRYAEISTGYPELIGIIKGE